MGWETWIEVRRTEIGIEVNEWETESDEAMLSLALCHYHKLYCSLTCHLPHKTITISLFLQVSMEIPPNLFYVTILYVGLHDPPSKQGILTALFELVYIQLMAVFEWNAPQFLSLMVLNYRLFWNAIKRRYINIVSLICTYR